MTTTTLAERRARARKFDFVLEEGRADGLTSRLAFAMAIVALTIAAAFTVFDLALRTADQVFVDDAILNPPDQANVTFGRHELSFPGLWLTSPIALNDEMATAVSIQVPYDKLLSLIGAQSQVGTPEDTALHRVVLRLQVPAVSGNDVDLVKDVYIPKSAPMVATGPNGLAMRNFLNGSGYDGETLYMGQEGNTSFIARCLPVAPGITPSSIDRSCLKTVPVSADLEAVIQFHPAILEDWRKLDTLTKGLIRSITVR